MEQQQLPEHPLPEDYMKDIPQFLIQPKGSNLVIDAQQPVMEPDFWLQNERYDFYHRACNYYKKYHRKRSSHHVFSKIYTIVVAVLGTALFIGLAGLLFYLESLFMPEGLIWLLSFVTVFISGALLIATTPIYEFIDKKIITPIDDKIERRKAQRYELYLEKLREECRWMELSVISYYEALYQWLVCWESNHQETIYCAYMNRLDELSGHKIIGSE